MLIQRLELRNLLSFGPDSAPVDLLPLNVLIGPNGSGKSNFVEAIGLASATPKSLGRLLRVSDDVAHWIWRGQGTSSSAEIGVELADVDGNGSLNYRLGFRGTGEFFQIINETLEGAGGGVGADQPVVYFKRPPSNTLSSTRPSVQEAELTSAEGRPHSYTGLDDKQSLFTLVERNPLLFPRLCQVADALENIAIYRDWTFGRDAPMRQPQQPHLSSDTLRGDAANLGLVLNVLNQDSTAKRRVLDTLRGLYDGISDLRVNIEHNAVNVQIQEGDVTIPAMRLSDGTLRYLCLLAILCHPKPPALVCLEEPELGLHPDILPGLADLLMEASQRCQLIVTTHSDVLVDKLTDAPESVVVCEKHEGQTRMRRLDAQELGDWLDQYGSLGELWTRGQLGGNRW